MKYLKIFEGYDNQIEIKEEWGVYTATKGKSYIEYHYMKDTHSLVEFNGMDLESVYSEIGEECVFVQKVYIDPTDNPIILRRFVNIVENYTREKDVNVIVLVAEPFADKRLDSTQLTELYKLFGFINYEKLPDTENYIMYKEI